MSTTPASHPASGQERDRPGQEAGSGPTAVADAQAPHNEEQQPRPMPKAVGSKPVGGPGRKGGKPKNPGPQPLPARRARWKTRHTLVVLSFLLMVILPCAVSAYYLWTRAVDQYISRVGFSVRTEEANSAIELLGGITNLSGSSSSDTDILYEFLQSQELVDRIDDELDLRGIWSRVDPSDDPVFAYHAPGTIEDLVSHWMRQVRIYYDSGTDTSINIPATGGRSAYGTTAGDPDLGDTVYFARIVGVDQMGQVRQIR